MNDTDNTPAQPVLKPTMTPELVAAMANMVIDTVAADVSAPKT